METKTNYAELQTNQVFDDIVAIIQRHYTELKALPGVLGIIPGYGGINSQPVIVLITEDGEFVNPGTIEKVGVVSRTITPQEVIEGIIPLTAWKGIIEEAAPQIGYRSPDPKILRLEETQVSDILCHVGPDSGWSVLEPFLKATQKTLTVAMYEFYARHIIDCITELSENKERSLKMILQVDKNDQDAPERLKQEWGDRLDFVKASVSGPARIFNNSYHTKVAVRDSSAFWLSSGNWSPNSQPKTSTLNEKTIYNAGNREWHVIIKDEKLAGLYERYIEYDMKAARNLLAPESGEVLPDLFISMESIPESAYQQPELFKEKHFQRNTKVKPLMSPDNYASEVLELIKQAEHSIYLQFSYIRQPSTEIFNQIINALAQKMRDGLDVRILVGPSQTASHSDLLIAKRGWRRESLRAQRSKLHNKGILIDGNIALVGSNNWSSDGTQYNRDTSLVFYSKEIYDYYHQVFISDWDNMSRPIAQAPETTVIIAPENAPTPPGMQRISWIEFYG